MAVVTSRTCDIDPKHEEAQPYTFGVGPEFFTADLCAADKAKLDTALEPFVKVGAPIPVRDLMKNGQSAASSFDPATVRAWANANGKGLGERGRIPADVVEAWRKATNN